MSPAAGGAAPTQPAAASFDPAPAPTAAIGAPPQPQENLRDPSAQAQGSDPGNAAARKTAWNVPPPPPPSAAPVGGGIMGGEESWPALADAAAGRAWPKSASSDSLRSLSDGSAPSALEDLVVPSVPLQPVSQPISTVPSPSPASPSPPLSVAAAAPSPQNGSTSHTDLVQHGSSHGGNNGGWGHGGNKGGDGGGNGSNRSRSTGNNSSDGNSSSGGDGNWNDGVFGGSSNINYNVHSDSSNLNSSIHSGGSNLNSSVHSGGGNLNSSVHSGGIGGSGIDSSRRVLGSNNWNGNSRGGAGSNDNGNGNGNGDWFHRNNGGRGGGYWNNNGRNGSGSSNGFGGRGGRNRRDHERGGNFSSRNYSQVLPVQQQAGFYQPGPFQQPPPPPPAAHFMMPQPFGSYVPSFAYPGDVQAYPFYVTPVEQQFQNMHLVQQPMQSLVAQQDQLSLQHDIQHQIEHYFSTNNLCHDTYLRERMDDHGWVPIDLIATFPMCTRFTMLGIGTNYILDSLRGSELLEVQGNNIRRRNDWAAWLLRRGPPPSN